MAQDALIAIFCWVVGFMATMRTDWVVKRATAIQQRYPNAFSSGLAERSWYPTFLRVLGVANLFGAAFLTLEVLAAIWLHSRSHQ